MALTYIDIVTLPYRTTYYEGAEIDITGLEVHGYDENGNDLGAISNDDLTYTQYAAPHTGITAKNNAIVSTAGTTISSWSGSRSPVTKTNIGAAACFIGRNCIESSSSYGSDWGLFVGVSDTDTASRLTMNTLGSNSAAYTINNIEYHVCVHGSNSIYGGATSANITNPLNLPEVQNDTTLKTINVSSTTAQVKKYIRILELLWVGDAVTIEYNGLKVQYGISTTPGNVKAYVGVGNIAREVKKIYVGVNGISRNVIKGYVGVNNVPRLFWFQSSPSIRRFEIEVAVSFSNGNLELYNNYNPFITNTTSLGLYQTYFYDVTDGRTQINRYASSSITVSTPTRRIVEYKCKFATSGTAFIIGGTSTKTWKVTNTSYVAGTEPEDPYYYFYSYIDISVL